MAHSLRVQEPEVAAHVAPAVRKQMRAGVPLVTSFSSGHQSWNGATTFKVVLTGAAHV